MNLEEFKKVPFIGKWMVEKTTQSLWRPESYQKLDIEFPEAAHFGRVPEFNFKLQYDPIHDEYHIDDGEEPEKSPLSFLIAATFGSIVGIYSLRTLLLHPWKGVARKLITNQLGSSPAPIHSYGRLRKAFNSTEFFSGSEVKNHSHGVAAGHRAAVNRFVAAICVATGLDQYSFQMSKRDQSENMRGCRTYYWAKDVNAVPHFDEILPSDFITMIDVDYYMDMPDHLATHPQPHMIYTVQPECAGRVNDDYAYSFDCNGVMTWKVTGGATYKHEIWNYGRDWFTVSAKFLGIPYKTVVYDVQSRRTSPDKQLVLVSPMRVLYGLAAIFAYYMGSPLKRLNVSHSKGFNKIKVQSNVGRFVSVARVNTEVSATVLATMFDSLISTRNISPNTKLNLYQVKSLATNVMPGLDKDLYCPILTDYFNNASESIPDEIHVVDAPKLIAIAFATPEPGDKPCLEAFAKPFVPPAYVPLNNKSSSDQSIKGRVLAPRENAKEVLGEFKMTPTKQLAMAEFVKRLVPNPRVGTPYDFDEIAARQTKPGQKKDLLEAGFWCHVVRFVKTFMKREAYGKATDPRNITTFNPKMKIDYAGYMYSLMDHMKPFKFYAFGKPPKEVAERVASICSESKVVDCPDISRMDGYVNEMCRQLERAVGVRYFAPEYVDDFLRVHALAYGNKGITTHGMKYEQEFSRGSGEMGTSVWNTIINLFICYLASYLKTGNFDQSWEYLETKVLAGGDDGIIGDMTDKTLVRAARDVGFILKCPRFKRGDMGVNFLARVYGPDVWNGDPVSMCSLRRQMEKFHLVTNCNIPPVQKLFEKSLSFSYTDANTPVIGFLVTRVLDLARGFTTTNTITRYGDDWDQDKQYPNCYSDWMEVVAAEELPLTYQGALLDWIKNVDTLEELLSAPVFFEEGREFTNETCKVDVGMVIDAPTKIAESKDVSDTSNNLSDPTLLMFGSFGEQEKKAPVEGK
jgi:hypothetical protein